MANKQHGVISTLLLLVSLLLALSHSQPVLHEYNLPLNPHPPHLHSQPSLNPNPQPLFLHTFPFSTVDEQIYFHGRIDISQYHNTGSDVIEFTLPVELLANYFALSCYIQFLDNDTKQSLLDIQNLSFAAAGHDVYVEIPLEYQIHNTTKFVTFVGYFALSKRPQALSTTHQPHQAQFLAHSTTPKRHSHRPTLATPQQIHPTRHPAPATTDPTNGINSNTTNNEVITILLTYYPEIGDSTYTISHLQRTDGASRVSFYPDTTPYQHASSQSASQGNQYPLDNTSTIATLTGQANRPSLQLLQQQQQQQQRLISEDDLDISIQSAHSHLLHPYDDTNPCAGSTPTSFDCNRFHVVRTPAGKEQFQYSFRAYISTLHVPVVGFNFSLFGAFTGYVYDKSGCKMNSLAMKTQDQYVDPVTRFFTFSTLLHPNYQRPGGDTDIDKHIRYFGEDTGVDIWCWVVTDVFVSGDDIFNGVSLTFIPDPLTSPGATAPTINLLTRRITKLDTVTNHVVNPWRAQYNSFFSDPNLTEGVPAPDVEKENENDDETKVFHLSTSLLTDHLQSTNHPVLTTPAGYSSAQLLQHLSCEWFISSDIPFRPQYFNDSIQLTVFNLQNEATIEQALVSFVGPATDEDLVLQNHNLVLFKSPLSVHSHRRPDNTWASSRIIFHPVDITLDPEVTKLISPQITKLVFSILVSLHQHDVTPSVGTPMCAMQYTQPYQGYLSEHWTTRLPMIYSQTNKPSWRLFSTPNQFVITASELSNNPTKYSFNPFIFNMTIPRPIKWVLFNIVSSDYRFEGDFGAACYLNNITVTPIGQDQRSITYPWTTSLGFDIWYEPTTYYNLRCPDLYLIKSNQAQSDYHPNNSSFESHLQKNELELETLHDDKPHEMVQITVFGIETDSYIASYDDYYFAATTITFSYFRIDDATFWNFIATVSFIVGLLVAAFLAFCCCVLEPQRSLKRATPSTSTTTTTVLGEYFEVNEDDPNYLTNNNSLTNGGMVLQHDDDYDLYQFSQQISNNPSTEFRPSAIMNNSNSYREPLLQ